MRRAAMGLMCALMGGLVLAITACNTGGGADAAKVDAPHVQSACDIVRAWEAGRSGTVRHIAPAVTAETGDTIYQFAPNTAAVDSLRAECGNGPYSECHVSVTTPDGGSYSFAELSRFTLVEARGSLWMVFRLHGEKAAADQTKRRVVEIGRKPLTLCNEIGDYADVM